MSLGIAPVALQAIPTAFPALVNPAVRALAIAKRWWLTLRSKELVLAVDTLGHRTRQLDVAYGRLQRPLLLTGKKRQDSRPALAANPC
jgi:hypothetical protein